MGLMDRDRCFSRGEGGGSAKVLVLFIFLSAANHSPGMILRSGKWPVKKLSLAVTFCFFIVFHPRFEFLSFSGLSFLSLSLSLLLRRNHQHLSLLTLYPTAYFCGTSSTTRSTRRKGKLVGRERERERERERVEISRVRGGQENRKKRRIVKQLTGAEGPPG